MAHKCKGNEIMCKYDASFSLCIIFSQLVQGKGTHLKVQRSNLGWSFWDPSTSQRRYAVWFNWWASGLGGAGATACGRLEPNPLAGRVISRKFGFQLGLTKWAWIEGVPLLELSPSEACHWLIRCVWFVSYCVHTNHQVLKREKD